MKQLANIESTRHIQIVDALRYSLELERKAFLSIKSALRKIERADDGKGHPNHSVTLHAFSSAWAVIDTAHRIRGLITQVPGLSQKSPEIQVFVRSTATVEDFRHLYQHLNSVIPKINGMTNPIMGVLSWVSSNPSDSFTVFLGTGSKETQIHSVSIDTWNNCFAQNLLFSAGNKDIELDKLHSQCQAVSKFLNAWLKSKGYLSKESTKVGVFRFNIRPRSNN